jgi:DNA topoisomerase I
VKCKICQREAHKEDYCLIHVQAYLNLQEKFVVWQKATMVSWSQYLVEIQKNSLTGEWAKEVAKHLIGEENHNV